MPTIEVVRELDAPLPALFEILSDHAGFSRFPGVAEAELTRPGLTERNGLGAQRRLKVGGSMVWEDIVGFERDRLIEYRIVKLRPNLIRHEIGRQRFEALPDGRTRVHWTSHFEPRIPLIGRWLLKPVEQQFAKGFAVMLRSAEKLAREQAA